MGDQSNFTYSNILLEIGYPDIGYPNDIPID